MNSSKTFVGFLLLASSFAATAAEVTVYTSRAAFLAATTGIANVDLGPPRTVLQVPYGQLLVTAYPGMVTTVDRDYCCATYNRGATSAAGPVLQVLASYSSTITAICFDAFTVESGNGTGTNQDVIDLEVHGFIYHFTTPPAPNTIFIGFTSTENVIHPVNLKPSPASRQVNIQNISFGSALRIPRSSLPFGSVDTPLKNTTNVAGALGVTGWALSSATISTVGVWREPVSGESGNLVFVGEASMIPAVRPDVAASYPAYPNNTYGWGLQVLTNQLPGGIGQPLGNGIYKLHAIAINPEGESTDLGGPIPITVNNAAAVLPFGTIDTPTQGGIVSGLGYVNFGWALTPDPANVITQDGSTITVFIDNKPVGHPVYNNKRADIASLFPGLQNSNGAVGFYTIDTTKLAGGLHAISWLVTDHAGHSQGLGSRYFFVQN